jgi:hypothetical protein
MEKLQFESTGFWTTPSGLYAAEITHTSAKYLNDVGYEISYFEFRMSATSDVVRVEWPTLSGMGIFEADVIRGMVSRGWAKSIAADKADQYNVLVDEWRKAHEAKVHEAKVHETKVHETKVHETKVHETKVEVEAETKVEVEPETKVEPKVEVEAETKVEYVAPSEPVHPGRFKTKNKPVSEDKSS